MKNLLKLGTPLTKEAQKTVTGGRPAYYEPNCETTGEICYLSGQPYLCCE